MSSLCIIFDGPPHHESGRFVEVETPDGKSIRAGEWSERDDGFWCLTIPGGVLGEVHAERERQRAKGYDAAHDDGHSDQDIAAAAAFLAWPDGYTDGTCEADECLIPHPHWGYRILEKWQHDRRRQLIIAAALLVAEIERLDRAAEETP